MTDAAPTLQIRPITLRAACAFIEAHHRHKKKMLTRLIVVLPLALRVSL